MNATTVLTTEEQALVNQVRKCGWFGCWSADFFAEDRPVLRKLVRKGILKTTKRSESCRRGATTQQTYYVIA